MRTGDAVLHKPSGEKWLVAYVEGDDLVPVGWPLSYARPHDCEVVRRATDAQRDDLLRRMAGMQDDSDPRCRYARRVLAAETTKD